MTATRQKILILGGGFSSLSVACYLAKEGHEVTLLEQNSHLGGRARQLKRDGFTFDMGPTFYWMPDVFEDFFNAFEKHPSDYYQLERLDPAYQVYFGSDQSIQIGGNFEEIKATFEHIEKGSAKKLQAFMDGAKANYELVVKDLVYRPGRSIFEIINWDTIKRTGLFFKSIKKQVAYYFQNPCLQRILEFPVLFLGGTSQNTPAFYNFMNYADFCLGTWHPKGGMYSVVEAMVRLGKEHGVSFVTDNQVKQIVVEGGKVTRVNTNKESYSCDILVSGMDYQHTETLLEDRYRQYPLSYWQRKTFAPSALLFYVGFDRKLKNVAHHTLCFDVPFEPHFKAIYGTPMWPAHPLFYASFPSVTDPTMSPDGKDAGIFLIPLAPGLKDDLSLRESYFDEILSRLECLTGQSIKHSVLFKESYGISEFIQDYNAYKGNAYGLANTLRQTHILRPRLRSKLVKNLYFTGQLTLPGPGVPPSIISGKIVSDLLKKDL